MEFKMKEQVIVKLFAGCKIDPGLRHHLDHSSRWKLARLQPEQELIIAPYKGSEYIGIYLSSPAITLEKLKLIDSEVRKKIKEYCPKFNDKLMTIHIFSQVFVK